MICLDEGILRAYQDSELSEYEMLSVARHLSLCDKCCQDYETIGARSQSLSALFADLTPVPSELRVDRFAAQCAFTRFKARYEADFVYPVYVPAALRELNFLLPYEPLFTRLVQQLQINWLEFKRNPQGFLSQLWRGEDSNPVRRRRLQTGTMTAMASYVLLFTTLIIAGALNFGAQENPQDLKVVELIKLASPAPLETDSANGPADVPKGKGGTTGGNKIKTDPMQGGGGSGRNLNLPVSRGNPPQTSPLPQIMPPNPERLKTNSSLIVPETTVGDTSLSRTFPRPTGFKDGADAAPSGGNGNGAGVGTGDGTGFGPGSGAGQGPGRSYNQGSGAAQRGGGLANGAGVGVGSEIFDATYNLQPKITFREKAAYTEEARQNGIRGIAVISAVFGADGNVYDVQIVRGLPYGLSESAIEAAKRVRFRPAIKNGVAVNVRMQMEFSFNLY